MSKLIIGRELSRSNCRCVLPFCYRFQSLQTSDASVKRFERLINTNCEQNIDSKDKCDSNLEDNPFYGKYSDKIRAALKEKNECQSTALDEELRQSRVKDITKEQKPIKSEEKSGSKDQVKQRINTLKSKSSLNQRLDDIVKLDLLRDKSAQEISQIWKEYHMTRDCIFAVIPAETYDRMSWLSSKYKTFLLPVPRTDKLEPNKSNYEFILSQFVGHKCFFTPLLAYQTHQELAPVCLTVHYFPELQKDKQIVLMLGEFDSNILNGFEAQCLANQLQWYYSADGNVRQSILLHRFNCEPNLFDHMLVIRELEDHIMSIGSHANSAED